MRYFDSFILKLFRTTLVACLLQGQLPVYAFAESITNEPTSSIMPATNSMTQLSGYAETKAALNGLSAPSTNPIGDLKNALIASSGQRQNLNLLYGTSFKPTGPTTAWDNKLLSLIVALPSYNQAAYLITLQKTADYYRSLQADSVQRAAFNKTYGTYLQATGSPVYETAQILFKVANPVVETPPIAGPPPSTNPIGDLKNALIASSGQRQNLNLLYGTSFKPTGPTTAWDNKLLSLIVALPSYNQAAYLITLQKTADYYRSLQADSVQRAAFNKTYGTYLQATGSPVYETAQILFKVANPVVETPPIAGPPPTTPPPSIPGTLFSATSFWNTPLSATQALNANSANLVNELVAETRMAQPWMNTSSWSTGVYIADAGTPVVPVFLVQNGVRQTWTVLYDVLQKGVPIPAKAAPAAGTDGHVTILDQSTDTLYEFWQFRNVSGQWQASWGGVIKNYSTSNGVMPTVTNAQGGPEFWGATATGLPVVGGTILLKELAAGVIPHVLAMAIPTPKTTFVSPATRSDGMMTGANHIPEGTIFRFPSTITINPAWSPLVKMIVVAIRDYGVVVRDKAGCVTFYGEDPAQYGDGNPYSAYYGGKPLWDVMNQIPWASLQVIQS